MFSIELLELTQQFYASIRVRLSQIMMLATYDFQYKLKKFISDPWKIYSCAVLPEHFLFYTSQYRKYLSSVSIQTSLGA